MILHPTVLALVITSFLTSLMILYSGYYGIRILVNWDMGSGSELQLQLERRTYLISTMVGYLLALQLVSLFLFIFTADSISSLLVGAMCAVGTLSANGFGYPALLLKVAVFLLAGLWLILNRADNQGYDYPLIRKKYLLLLFMTPVILAETVCQALFFLGLRPDIITSCCGSLFSPEARGIATEMAGLPPLPTLAAFYASAAVTLASGVYFYLKGRGCGLFASLNLVHLVVTVVAIISVVSLYIYRMPSHHCPFCILQREYLYVGYPLYAAVLTGGVTGAGTGMLLPFRTVSSLREVLPGMTRRLSATSLACTAFSTLLVSWEVLATGFTLR